MEVEDENMISDDGLLTSLTDAAISNLSQLAALQERCESQQHSQKYQQQKQQANEGGGGEEEEEGEKEEQHTSPLTIRSASALPGLGHRTNTTSGVGSLSSLTSSSSTSFRGHHHHHHHQQQQQHPLTTGIQSGSSILSSDFSSTSHHHHQHQQRQHLHQQQQQYHDPFSNRTIANQAALAISAVAAAAAAAATADDDNNPQQQQQQPQPPHHHHHLSSSPMDHSHTTNLSAGSSRISSALSPSPDFYHSLQQHHHHAQQQLQHHHHHHHNHHHQHQQRQQQHQQSSSSPSSSSLHFSSSASVTPSPSSLMLGAAQQTRRSPSTNTSSSLLMSPIASPNYLRRQFMPDRLSLLSPSPTASTSGVGSGRTTACSSVGSTSLAHILNQHHHHHPHHNQQHQQRSASALPGGSISMPPPAAGGSVISLSGAGGGGTAAGGSGSSAVSPLMSNKNSSQARLNNMQIRHKFGYLGSGRAQFNSPHGFCLGLNQEIVVADTNNHRVCIFDKSGTYITQFGSPGKEEGQLWNPRKVAILHRPVSGGGGGGGGGASSSASSLLQLTQPSSSSSNFSLVGSSTNSSSHNNNNINSTNNNNSQLQSNIISNNNSEPVYVVCDRGAERSRMQLFTKDGAFIKKIGIHYIDIVAGLAITQSGLIIVVDSVSPTVYIINGETGILNGWFDCSGYMKEPSDIAVKSDVPCNEYFICDFKGHCVVVFSEQGEYLRKFGQDGLTSYPNGIDISDDGDILVGDSHGNRFHVVVFDRNGNFVSQFECPHVKVSRCCGLKITREGYIVTLAKNNHHVLVLDTIHI